MARTTATMFAHPSDLAPAQCPLCGNGDQHKPECVLFGKPHVYVDTSQGLVDWLRTIYMNDIEITSTNSNMVEQAAQAAWKQLAHDTHSDVPWDDPSMHDQRERMRGIVRAVMEALREPTQIMKWRGNAMAELCVISAADWEYSAEVSDECADLVWNGMIDAALES